jgi:hypothetical protein
MAGTVKGGHLVRIGRQSIIRLLQILQPLLGRVSDKVQAAEIPALQHFFNGPEHLQDGKGKSNVGKIFYKGALWLPWLLSVVQLMRHMRLMC